MDLSSILEMRRSIRRYMNQDVEEAKLLKILEAGRLAPTARNNQDWYCIIVKDLELRKKMVEACADQKMVLHAPVNLVICGKNQRFMLNGQNANSVDCSIVLTIMILKATELGLGTCWLGKYDNEKVKDLLEIPNEDNVIAITPLGYADQVPEFRGRKNIEQFIIRR